MTLARARVGFRVDSQRQHKNTNSGSRARFFATSSCEGPSCVRGPADLSQGLVASRPVFNGWSGWCHRCCRAQLAAICWFSATCNIWFGFQNVTGSSPQYLGHTCYLVQERPLRNIIGPPQRVKGTPHPPSKKTQDSSSYITRPGPLCQVRAPFSVSGSYQIGFESEASTMLALR